MWWCSFLGLAHGAPQLDAVVAAGVVVASGEGSGAPVRPGLHGLVRGRAVATEGALRVGGELDERTSWVLASRKALLLGAGAGPVSLLTGAGVVERGLFGPNARVDLHVPVEGVVDLFGPVHLQARARTWFTVLERADEPAEPVIPGTGGLELNVAVALPRPERLGPRLEAGVREEFGHLVWLVALGAGT